IMAIAALGFGIWMSTHHDECRRSLTLPVLGVGVVICLMFIVTNNGSGHRAAGLRLEEFQVQGVPTSILQSLVPKNSTLQYSHQLKLGAAETPFE
ncbi:hypothetical protein RJ641_001069, partial [Dillenia turbinata]